MQTMAAQLGGQVENSGCVIRYPKSAPHGASKLLDGIQDPHPTVRHGLLDVWMSHGDKVTALPRGFKLIASTRYPIAGMATSAQIYRSAVPRRLRTRARAARSSAASYMNLRLRARSGHPDYLGEAVEKVRREVGKEECCSGYPAAWTRRWRPPDHEHAVGCAAYCGSWTGRRHASPRRRIARAARPPPDFAADFSTASPR